MTVLGVRLRDLGSETLTWADLAIILTHPRKGGPLHAALHGERAQWDSLDSQLLAVIADRLGHIAWQLGGDDTTEPPESICPDLRSRRVLSDDPLADEDALSMDELADLLDIDE